MIKMKKNNFWVGTAYLAAGIIFLPLSLSPEITLGHYFYWTKPAYCYERKRD